MPKTIRKVSAKAHAQAAGIGGTKNIITQTDPFWNVILKRLGRMGRTYGFQRVEMPILDDVDLFDQYYNSMANAPEPVTVEVNGKSMMVRPTILPQVLRHYAGLKDMEEIPMSKWLYMGNVIKPQQNTGGVSSEYEFGTEVLGTFTHLTEAQTIAAIWHLVQELGLAEATLEINTIGDNNSQATYGNVLHEFLNNKKFELCDTCNESLNTRVFDVLRCNNLECQVVFAEAPTVLDFLDDNSQKHFTLVLEALDELQIPYQLNPLLVGPAGSSRTNCIIRYKHNSHSVIIAEGAYHDTIIKGFSGNEFSCFGFQGSLTALHKAMELATIEVLPETSCEVFLVPLGELASKRSLRLFHDLTIADVRVYDHFGTVGVKNQLKQAEDHKSPIALIMGQKEAMDEMVILRDVKSGMQELFSYDKIVIEVKKRLGR